MLITSAGAHALRRSLILLQRSPVLLTSFFNAVIQTSSYARLVHKMRDRLEVLRKES